MVFFSSHFRSALPRAEDFYSCREDAMPVLHDTAIRLNVQRSFESPNIDLLSDIPGESKELLQFNGSVIKPLNLSLSRGQYEQLLETVENLFKVPSDLARPPSSVQQPPSSSSSSQHQQSQQHVDLDAAAFEFDAKFKRRLFDQPIEKKTLIEPKVTFELPIFIIQLRNELNHPLIDVVFRDFNVNYERSNTYETNLLVSLRSLLMEDLLQPPDSKHRSMLVSSSPDNQPLRPNSSAYSSRSCPNLIGLHFPDDGVTGSLPENLECGAGFGHYLNASGNATAHHTHHQYTISQHKSNCPETPPPSPQRRMRQENLVLYSSVIVDPECPNFGSQYNSMRQTSSIDFNSLDLIVSVQSWYALLDFFGVFSDTNDLDGDGDNDNEADDDHNASNEVGGNGNSDGNASTTEPTNNSELEISVRSLTLVFARPEYEIAKANVSSAHFIVSKLNASKTVKGRLGSVSLFDLTAHGALYRERFLTSGNEALNFTYTRAGPKPTVVEHASLKSDAMLKIKMSSVRYVHTKRFIAEIQAFVTEFQGLQAPSLIRKIKSSESRTTFQQRPTQLRLSIKAGSPMILLPLSAKSNRVIVADLGEFSLENSFHFASETEHVISVRRDVDGTNEILDVMLVNLVNTDLFAGERHAKQDDRLAAAGIVAAAISDPLCMDMGSYVVCKQDANLLNDKCQLKLIVERNLETWRSHNVPDFSVQGTLSRLEAVLNLQQYQLVRGFLQHNLGEALDDIVVSGGDPIEDCIGGSRFSLTMPEASDATDSSTTWTSMSITLDLQDVSVRLQVPNTDPVAAAAAAHNRFAHVFDGDRQTSLACINFIKSTLKIDTLSDGSQDIDLVSQEILVTDSRFARAHNAIDDDDDNGNIDGSSGKRRNVFTNILQPIKTKSSADTTVQAEVHTRKRQDFSKYTILLNDMRVMAILDWLECVRDFLSQDCDDFAPLAAAPPAAIASRGATAVRSPSGGSSMGAGEMEVILNITNSELVFVEKTDQWDSSAVILKSTTVLSFRPAEVNKVMSINLNHLEVFSCILGFEEDTALSIIDPITINMDLRKNTLDVQLQKRLCVRLSYNDLKMFMKMLESLPQQTRQAQTTRETHAPNELLVQQLTALGFAVDDCRRALTICHDNINDSALWLTQNAEPNHTHALSAMQMPSSQSALDIRAIVLRASCISICVIDDCKDADVPLLEMSFSELEGRQELGNGSAVNDDSAPTIASTATAALSPTGSVNVGYRSGYLKGVFASDYYNRVLSGWEPLIEPWKCESTWSYSLAIATVQSNRLHLRIVSDDLLKLNITTTIIELFQLVYENWTQDYYGSAANKSTQITNPASTLLSGGGGGDGGGAATTNFRRRTPFVPFALKNDTGAKLMFTMFVSTAGASGSVDKTDTVPHKSDTQRWVVVEPGEVVPFNFGPSHKQRHHDTHTMNLHQVGVRIDGWTEVGPVSVDRVGVFFRYARHELAEFMQLPRARVVFSVSLEGSAQKLVTVRSALRVINQLDRHMLLKMEHLKTINYPDAITAILAPAETYSVPLSHVQAHLFVVPIVSATSHARRPVGNESPQSGRSTATLSGDAWPRKADAGDTARMYFCERIHWRDMDDGADVQQWFRTCKSSREKCFRIVAAIHRDGYPTKDSGTIPGHTIVLVPPLRLHNLLPCDLLYKLTNNLHGRVSPSETANVHDVDLESQTEITLTLDSYPGAEKITIPSGHTGSVDYRIKLTDTKGRLLILRASIQMAKGNGLQITISAPYWLINRTGLPLIFRQEGVSQESSGQFNENEQARLVSPLMFSFTDPDASPALTVRLGKRYGPSPPWCQPFNLHKDILHQQLRSGITNETFIIGTEVRCGRGRYAKTRVVTFSPRFQLYNRSSYKLQFAQKYCADSSVSRK